MTMLGFAETVREIDRNGPASIGRFSVTYIEKKEADRGRRRGEWLQQPGCGVFRLISLHAVQNFVRYVGRRFLPTKAGSGS